MTVWTAPRYPRSTTAACAKGPGRTARTARTPAWSGPAPSSGKAAPAQGRNGVLRSGPDTAGADPAIAGQIAYFTGLGRVFEWKLYGHDLPVDLGRRPRGAGFAPRPEETLTTAEAADLDLGAEPPATIVAVVALAGDEPVSATRMESCPAPGSPACGAAAPARRDAAAVSTGP